MKTKKLRHPVLEEFKKISKIVLSHGDLTKIMNPQLAPEEETTDSSSKVEEVIQPVPTVEKTTKASPKTEGATDTPKKEEESTEGKLTPMQTFDKVSADIKVRLTGDDADLLINAFLTKSCLKIGCINPQAEKLRAEQLFANITDRPLLEKGGKKDWEKIAKYLAYLQSVGIETIDQFEKGLLDCLESKKPENLEKLFLELFNFLPFADIEWAFPSYLQYEARNLSSDTYLTSLTSLSRDNKRLFLSEFAKKLARTVIDGDEAGQGISGVAQGSTETMISSTDLSQPLVSEVTLSGYLEDAIFQLCSALRAAERIKGPIMISDVLSGDLGILGGCLLKSLNSKYSNYSQCQEERMCPGYLTLLDIISCKSFNLTHFCGLRDTPDVSVEIITSRVVQKLKRVFYKLSFRQYKFRLIWVGDEPKNPYFMIDEYIEGDAKRVVSDNHLTFFKYIKDSFRDRMPHYTLQFMGDKSPQSARKVHIFDMGIRMCNVLTRKDPNAKAPSLFAAFAKKLPLSTANVKKDTCPAIEACKSAVVSYVMIPKGTKSPKKPIPDPDYDATVKSLLAASKTEPGYAHMCSLFSSFLGVLNLKTTDVQSTVYEEARREMGLS